MRAFFNWLRSKYLCIRYGTKDCKDCRYCYDKTDWWGCGIGAKNHRK